MGPDKDLTDAELRDSLDRNREIVVFKVEGLTREAATSLVMPSGVTLLGIVQHLAWVERSWFEHHLLGEPAETTDIDGSFRIDPSAGVVEVLDAYRATCARSRAIVDAAPSFDISTREPHWFFGTVTLRWLLFHMTRETARHAGHLDILRELTDGSTGHG